MGTSAAERAFIANLEGSQTLALEKLMVIDQVGWASDPDAGDSVMVQKGTGVVILALDGRPVRNPSPRTHAATPFPRAMIITRLVQPNFEEIIPHMYLDSKGLVTIGGGHLMRRESDLDKVFSVLGLVDKNTRKPATISTARNEYRKIAKMKSDNRTAASFAKDTNLVMSTSSARALMGIDLNGIMQDVFKDPLISPALLGSFPRPVQEAIGDMAFNTGGTGFRKFKKFIHAARHRDWKTAAEESKRLNIRQPRNTAIKNLLLSAIERFFITTDPVISRVRLQLTIGGKLKQRNLMVPFKPR